MKRILLPVTVLALLTSCITKQDREGPKLPVPRIDQVLPDKVLEGQGFNVQPGGGSALSILGAHFGPGARIRFNGEPVETVVSSSTNVAAIIPPKFFAKAGVLAVSVDLPDGRVSNQLPWVILGKSGPPPVVLQLYPPSTKASQSFNVQSDGQSAMGLTGRGFLPGAKILINGEEVDSTFDDLDRMGCLVPRKFFAQPGAVRVTVRNADGKESAPAIFKVE
jgi:hypothetical protein